MSWKNMKKYFNDVSLCIGGTLAGVLTLMLVVKGDYVESGLSTLVSYMCFSDDYGNRQNQNSPAETLQEPHLQ